MTCVFPSKPEGDTQQECSDGQNGTPLRHKIKASTKIASRTM